MFTTTAIRLALFSWVYFCQVVFVAAWTCSDVQNFSGWSSKVEGDYNRRWTITDSKYYSANLNIDRDCPWSPCDNIFNGRLSSPLLEPQPGHDCLLSFDFYIAHRATGTSDRCSLTLYQKNNDSGTETRLWTHTSSDKLSTSVDVNCSRSHYLFYFDGERTDTSVFGCGLIVDYNIRLDNIKCVATHTSSSAPSRSTTPFTTTVSSTRPTSSSSFPSSQTSTRNSTGQSTTSPVSRITYSSTEAGNVTAAPQNAGDGPSTGVIAGIVVAVVIVIAIAVVVVVFVLRRRKQNVKPPGPASPDYVNTRPRAEGIPVGRANPAYELDSSVTSRVNGNASNYSEANYESTAAGGYELASTRQPARGDYHSSSPDPYSHLSRGGARNGPGVDDTYDHTQTAGAANGENAYSLAKVPREKDLARKPRTAASNYTNVEAPNGNDYNHLGEPIPDPTTTPTTEYSVAKPLPSHISSGEAAAIYEVAGSTDYEAVDEAGGNLMTSRSATSGKPMTSPSGPSDDYYSGLDLKGEKKAKQGDLGYLHNYDHARDPAALNADDYNVLDVDDSRSRDQQRNVAADEYSHV